METPVKYEQTVYLFKEINPTKKFSTFSYSDMSFDKMSCVYCNKDEILKIGENFYMYSGEIKNHWTEKRPSVIRFKKRAKVVKEILA